MTTSSERIRDGKRLPRVVTTALSMLCLAGGFIGCEGDRPTRPNLVLITVDRLAADRLHCFGGEIDAGGSICALGQQGTLFAWAATPGGGEASAAATVLTGLSEAIHGVGSDGQSFLANTHPTIAEDLSEAGYVTAAFVASPRVNHSRRLDQGFDLYDDRLASPNRSARSKGDRKGGLEDDAEGNIKNNAGSIDFSGMVSAWIDSAPSPWFVWLHADREAGLVELDRLLSRLSQTFDGEDGGPGILFLALRGERESAAPGMRTTTGADRTIGWRTHRVPMVWRPPAKNDPSSIPIPVSRRLATLMDIVPTLRAAAQLPTPDDSRPHGSGRDLGGNASHQPSDSTNLERFLLLETAERGGDVGLASQQHLYVRNASPLDGTGRPVETSALNSVAARFATLPDYDPLPNSARLAPGPWRKDVLAAESPVPRLEFHLARQLVTRREPGQNEPNRRDPQ